MKELSLNILDITENSVHANADFITISLAETDETLALSVEDNGKGMEDDVLRRVTDPFCTSRTTRKVGMGIPLLKLAAEQTGGHFSIDSVSVRDNPDTHGTVTRALFYKNHLDFTPLGDMISTLCTLVQGSENIDFVFTHTYNENSVSMDTREIRETLGGDIPLSEPDVLAWLREYLTEQYNILYI